MLPVYDAVSYEGTMRVGRTVPWIIIVDTGTDYKPFVVKMFTSQEVAKRDCVSKEVFGNVLAPQFDLPVPMAALINIGKEFEKTLRGKDIIKIYDNLDHRIKFGTEQLSGVLPLDASKYTASEVKSMIHIDDLFAFDNLIRNRDRKRLRTPNLLIKRDGAFLIDHELAFEITSKSFQEVTDKSWQHAFYVDHVFYLYLKQSLSKNKTEYFNTFTENLKFFDFGVFDSCSKQLRHYGHPVGNHQIIRQYLLSMKANAHTFTTLLSGIIQ